MEISKKKITGFVAGIAALALIVGSWAYYTSTSTIDNNLHTKSYADRTVEEFTPDQDIEPGTDIKKVVGVENTGDYDLVVRVKMDESWTPGGSDTSFINFSSANANFKSVVKSGDTYTATQTDPTDGETTGDETVMYKGLDTTGWTAEPDSAGYWYYSTRLTPGASTGNLLNNLVLATNTDMGLYAGPVEYYSTADKTAVETAKRNYRENPTPENKAALEAAYAWTAVKPADTATINYIKSDNALDPDLHGYANANYKLSIVTEVCQATKSAVAASWTTGTVPTALIDLLD